MTNFNNAANHQVTRYNVITGGANNTLNNVVPSATSGVPVISQGSSSQPVFGTAVVAGGGTGDTSFTAYAVLCGGTTSTGALQNVSGVGTSGQVLTSNGASALPTWQAASGGSGITTIDGDTGSITGTTVTIKAGVSTQNCGSSVEFVNSGTTSTLNLSDSNNNTILGMGAGNATISGSANIALGYQACPLLSSGSSNCAVGAYSLNSLTTGNSNTAIGENSLVKVAGGNSNIGVGMYALENLVSGASNIGIGATSGSAYTTSESNNIIIGFCPGTVGESQVTRIGYGSANVTSQTKCFIDGIQGVSVSNKNIVTINTSTGQLGSQSPTTVGNWVLISSQTASASSSITFTSGITSTYNSYVLVCSNVLLASNPQTLTLLISTNGGSSYIATGYQSGYNYSNYSMGSISNQHSTTGFILFYQPPTSGVQSNGTFFLQNMTNGNGYPAMTGQFTSYLSPNLTFGTAGGNYNTASTTVNALQIISTSGNITSGVFTLYGILE